MMDRSSIDLLIAYCEKRIQETQERFAMEDTGEHFYYLQGGVDVAKEIKDKLCDYIDIGAPYEKLLKLFLKEWECTSDIYLLCSKESAQQATKERSHGMWEMIGLIIQKAVYILQAEEDSRNRRGLK